jgi:hypothetical protein
MIGFQSIRISFSTTQISYSKYYLKMLRKLTLNFNINNLDKKEKT